MAAPDLVAGAGLLAATALKGAVVLALAAVGVALLRRAPAAARASSRP